MAHFSFFISKTILILALDTVMIGDDVRDDVLGAQSAGFKVVSHASLLLLYIFLNVICILGLFGENWKIHRRR